MLDCDVQPLHLIIEHIRDFKKQPVKRVTFIYRSVYRFSRNNPFKRIPAHFGAHKRAGKLSVAAYTLSVEQIQDMAEPPAVRKFFREHGLKCSLGDHEVCKFGVVRNVQGERCLNIRLNKGTVCECIVLNCTKLKNVTAVMFLRL